MSTPVSTASPNGSAPSPDTASSDVTPSDASMAVRKRIASVFEAQKAFAPSLRHTDANQRRAKLKRLREGVLDRRHEIQEALRADFRKPSVETDLSEIKAAADEALFVMRNLEDWMAPERVQTPPLLLGTSSEIVYQPKGVALIISPWNYPVNLTLSPLIAALAAGNTAILKPSEFTPNATAVLRDLVESLFDEREVALFEGDASVAQALLDQPFDHIYFTGSPAVGKIVMRAAAEHLTPVTLELGGKSPAIVDATADVDDAAAKIAWGKFTNAGQTCIAPDYVLAHASIHDDLVDALRSQIQDFFGDTPEARKASEDYARIVNARHFNRVKQLLEDAQAHGATVAAGGDFDADQQYLAPTILTDVSADAAVMEEEIFGPILPVVPFRTRDEALRIINARPNPLALYLFTTSTSSEKTFLTETQAGGSCVNEVLLHYMNPNMPFGGAGHSGIGSGHGKFAFQEMSNSRSVLRRSLGSRVMRNMYPPYGPLTKKAVDWAMRWF